MLMTTGSPTLTLGMSFSFTLTWTSMLERSATRRISVPVKLLCATTLSPTSELRRLMLPSIGERITVLLRESLAWLR